MKTVYFVRHGQTEGNKNKIHQAPTITLSEVGHEQAEYVAKRLTSVPFDIIVSSTMTRARQTADKIAKATNHEIIESELFREILPSSSIWGKSASDEEAIRVFNHHLEHFENDAERHSDEEKYSEFKARCLKALDFVFARKEETILVVTHGTVLAGFMTFMMLGEKATANEFLSLNKFVHASNTGITKCVYKEDRWRLWTWNDDAHLGEVAE